MSTPPRTTVVLPRPQLPSWLGWSSGLAILAVLFLLITGSNSVYSVPIDSVAVVLRFGKYTGTPKPPGLHFKIPFVDQKIIVPVDRQKKMEFGFATPDATDNNQTSSRREQSLESSMITGDTNAASVQWVVQYRIEDPSAYLFHVRNPEETLRDASESIMRQVVGDRLVDEVLTVGRDAIEDDCREKLRALCEEYSLGIRIDQLQLKDVTPPAPVRNSFNEVNQAQQDRERLINEAEGQYNKIVPKAKGEADREIAMAEGQATRRVNEAEGDAARFNAVYAEYEKAPIITRQRLYLETMSTVLPMFRKRIIMDSKQSGVLPLLQLDRESSPSK